MTRPIALAKSAKWAADYAEARFLKVWSKVEQIDDPKLYNDAYEMFSDQKRTPREKIRAMEFRLESFMKDKREAWDGDSAPPIPRLPTKQ